jgi:hypothetical protein
MMYHDRQFVELGYRLILGRPADLDGLTHHLDALRRGESRREIAFRLGTSSEAKERGFNAKLFASYRTWRRIERIPVLGTFVLILFCLARFKRVVRELRRLQNAVFGAPSAVSMPVSE